MKKKGILLYSGGLDSLLAAKVLMEQGIELIGLHFILPFAPPDYHPEESDSVKYATRIGLSLSHFRCGMEYLEMVKNPPHGYGKEMNPCIDCKIYFLRKAAELMVRENASFVATGEVVGQRPMSQMKNMLLHIEKSVDLKGYVMRPLSARILEPTIAEQGGIVDREKLYGISGRSRAVQFELARKYGIEEYSSPAGGCLFTDRNIAARVRDLFERHPEFNPVDMYLLTIGRHYRLSPGLKIIVGRNERENIELEKYAGMADAMFVPEFKGPSIFAKGALNDGDCETICAVAGRYGNYEKGGAVLNARFKNGGVASFECGPKVDDTALDAMRI